MSNQQDGGRGPSPRSRRKDLYLTPELAERVEGVSAPCAKVSGATSGVAMRQLRQVCQCKINLLII
jgi:hypothetical protein